MAKSSSISFNKEELEFLEEMLKLCMFNGRSPFFYMLHDKFKEAFKRIGNP